MHSIHLKEFDHANYTINVMYVFINLIADYLFSKFQIMALSQLIRIIELGKNVIGYLENCFILNQ